MGADLQDVAAECYGVIAEIPRQGDFVIIEAGDDQRRVNLFLARFLRYYHGRN